MERGVVVCFDCRNHSQEFARETARVMAGNGIKVKLFDSLRPTPELSFAVREYHAIAGVNVTASHNPKEYNGYKVYWEDGAQLPPHHASAIAAKMEELDIFDSIQLADYDQALASGMITLIGAETDEKFLANVMAQVNDPESVKQGGRQLLHHLHPLPRHRLQADSRGSEAPGHEACDLRARADGH